jgi:hypothetical protein
MVFAPMKKRPPPMPMRVKSVRAVEKLPKVPRVRVQSP